LRVPLSPRSPVPRDPPGDFGAVLRLGLLRAFLSNAGPSTDDITAARGCGFLPVQADGGCLCSIAILRRKTLAGAPRKRHIGRASDLLHVRGHDAHHLGAVQLDPTHPQRQGAAPPAPPKKGWDPGTGDSAETGTQPGRWRHPSADQNGNAVGECLRLACAAAGDAQERAATSCGRQTLLS
jgi:hypothetical protein